MNKHTNLVVESVWEAGRLVLVDGHGAVIGEVGVIHHRVHVVASDGEERCSHSPGQSGQILVSHWLFKLKYVWSQKLPSI